MEPIRIAFTLTKADYRHAMQASDMRKPLTRLVLGTMMFWILISACLIVGQLLEYRSFNTPRMNFYLLPMGLAVLYLLLRFAIYPLFYTSKIDKAALATEQINCVIDNEYIQMTSQSAESKIAWNFFHEVIESKQSYLLVHKANKRLFNFIPKRAFESPEHEAAFRALVEAHLGAIKK